MGQAGVGSMRARPKSVIQSFAGGVEQQVGRLDVAVEDAVLVGVVQGLGGLHAEAGDGAVVVGGRVWGGVWGLGTGG